MGYIIITHDSNRITFGITEDNYNFIQKFANVEVNSIGEKIYTINNFKFTISIELK